MYDMNENENKENVLSIYIVNKQPFYSPEITITKKKKEEINKEIVSHFTENMSI